MTEKIVREFHHTLLWPVQLRPMKRDASAGVVHYWETLKRNPGPWSYVDDPLLINDATCVIGYEEFVYFLPYVQRFLYGVGDEGAGRQSSLHVFHRHDIKQTEIRLRPNEAAITLDVLRTRLYFFYDIDVALLVLEVAGSDLPLRDVIDIMDRFGRAYAPAWDASMHGAHSPEKVTFLGEGGAVLAESDYGDQAKYLALVRDSRQTPISRHWEYLLQPMLPASADAVPGVRAALRYTQLENKRIPVMSYLTFDDPRVLSRGDMVRIGFSAKWGESDTLPYAEPFLADFERQNCYDRYWEQDANRQGMDTRYLFCGLSFSAITHAGPASEILLRQFRHQFYQIGLIAHFHKAALLSLSNRFSRAVERLNVRDFESVKNFKRDVRQTLEVFLRFNHRYWFHEISNQVQASDFFKRWSNELDSDALYDEVREEARDINEYLDADRMRKQTDNAMRLTVVSSCGMVGTVATGFLGMNLYSHSDMPISWKIIIFFIVFIPVTALSLYTVVISKRLANFMESMASEGLTWREKFTQFRQIWGANKRQIARNRRDGAGLSSDINS